MDPPAGVSYSQSQRGAKKFKARYRGRDGKPKAIGYFATEEEAAHAYNAALAKHGLESIRKVNTVDEKGRLVAKPKQTPPDPTADKKPRYYGPRSAK